MAVGRTRSTTELDILNRSSRELSELVKGVEAQTPKLTHSSEELSAVSQQLSASAEETSTQANLVATAADQTQHHGPARGESTPAFRQYLCLHRNPPSAMAMLERRPPDRRFPTRAPPQDHGSL